MATITARDFSEWFPKLKETPHRQTSQPTPRYNCIAYAAGDKDRWWEPDEAEDYYWPPDAPREYSISGFIRAFECIGFQVCDSGDHEPGYEKVALFVNDDGPNHAARQFLDGNWRSKLGAYEDIEHVLEAITGSDREEYGEIACFMKRGRSQEARQVDVVATRRTRSRMIDLD